MTLLAQADDGPSCYGRLTNEWVCWDYVVDYRWWHEAGGAFVLHKRIPWKLALGAVLGGIAMGYGARLAGGCNIGAYFSGIASFSLHGWIWAVVALGGTWVGLRLRPLFGLTNPKPADSLC